MAEQDFILNVITRFRSEGAEQMGAEFRRALQAIQNANLGPTQTARAVTAVRTAAESTAAGMQAQGDPEGAAKVRRTVTGIMNGLEKTMANLHQQIQAAEARTGQGQAVPRTTEQAQAQLRKPQTGIGVTPASSRSIQREYDALVQTAQQNTQAEQRAAAEGQQLNQQSNRAKRRKVRADEAAATAAESAPRAPRDVAPNLNAGAVAPPPLPGVTIEPLSRDERAVIRNAQKRARDEARAEAKRQRDEERAQARAARDQQRAADQAQQENDRLSGYTRFSQAADNASINRQLAGPPPPPPPPPGGGGPPGGPPDDPNDRLRREIGEYARALAANTEALAEIRSQSLRALTENLGSYSRTLAEAAVAQAQITAAQARQLADDPALSRANQQARADAEVARSQTTAGVTNLTSNDPRYLGSRATILSNQRNTRTGVIDENLDRGDDSAVRLKDAQNREATAHQNAIRNTDGLVENIAALTLALRQTRNAVLRVNAESDEFADAANEQKTQTARSRGRAARRTTDEDVEIRGNEGADQHIAEQRVTAQRYRNLRGRVDEEAAALVEGRRAQREYNQALMRSVRELERDRNGSSILTGGTRFQRAQALIHSTGTGEVQDPTRFQTGGQFLASRAFTTAGFALSGAALYGSVQAIQDMVREAEELDRVMAAVESQFVAINQASQFRDFRESVLEIARESGVAADETATVAFQMKGAFGGTREAIDETRNAIRASIVTGIEQRELTDSLTGAALTYGISIEEVTDAAIGLEERFGVLARESLKVFGDLGPSAKEAGLELAQLNAIVGTIQANSGRTGTAIAESLGRILPAIGESGAQIYQLYQSTPQLAANAPNIARQLGAGETGKVLEQLIRDFDRLDKSQQQYVVTLLGGRREAQTLNALFNNTSRAIAEMDRTQGDAGKTTQRFQDIQNTLQGTLRRLGEEWTQIGDNLARAGLFDALKALAGVLIGVVQVMSFATRMFGDLNEATNSLPGQLLAVAAGIMAIRLAMNGIGSARGVGRELMDNLPTRREAAARTASQSLGGVVAGEVVGEVAGNALGGRRGRGFAVNTQGVASEVGEEIAESAATGTRQGIRGVLPRIANDLARLGQVSFGPSLFSGFLRAARSGAAAFRGAMATIQTVGLGAAAAGAARGVAGAVTGAVAGAGGLRAVAAGGIPGMVIGGSLLGLRYAYNRRADLRGQTDESRERIENRLGEMTYSQARAAQQNPGFRMNAFERAGAWVLGQTTTDTMVNRAVEDKRVRMLEAVRGNPAILDAMGIKQEDIDRILGEINDNKRGDAPEAEADIAIGRLGGQNLTNLEEAARRRRAAIEAVGENGERAAQSVEQAAAQFEAGEISLQQYLRVLDQWTQSYRDINNPNDEEKIIALSRQRRDAIAAAAAREQQIGALFGQLSGEDPAQELNRLRAFMERNVQRTPALPLAPEGAVSTPIGQPVGAPTPEVQLERDSAILNTARAKWQSDIERAPSAAAAAAIAARGPQLLPPEQAALARLQEQYMGAWNGFALSISEIDSQRQRAAAEANSRFNLQKSATRDPAAIARISAAQARDAISRAGNNVTEANDARAQLNAAKEEERQVAQDTAQARIDLFKAQNPENALAQAQAAQQEADLAARNAAGTADRLRAQAQRIAADRAVEDAIEAAADATDALLTAIAESQGNHVEAAAIGVGNAQRELDAALRRNAGPEVIQQLRANLVNAQFTQHQAYMSEQEELINFRLEMGEITRQQAIAQYEGLLAIANPEDRRRLLLQIKQLREAASGADLQFNMPDIDLPTLYTARRMIEQGRNGNGQVYADQSAHSVMNDNRQIQVILNANNGLDGQAAVQTIVEALNEAPRFGTQPRLY